MDNVAFDSDGPTLISVKQNSDVVKDTAAAPAPVQLLVNGGDELKKDGEKDAYEIILIDGEEGEKKVVILEEMEIEKEVAEKPYADMGKDDLLRFSETPFWRRARIISILLFWAAWLALLGAVIGLTIVAPRCGDPPEPQWWQKTAIYQIYIRSFYDSDSDGIGDLNGITAKLDYLKELGVGAILVSSFYKADDADGTADYGYQVLDHRDILPAYGTMSDFEQLVNETHKRDMAILVDFIPNYTSAEHMWFTNSSIATDYNNDFWNYYVWTDCPGGAVPTNWLSVYGQSAWKLWEPDGTRCYLHQFLESEPDLNLRSSAVRNELETTLRFWLEKGVDGFRVVASAYLIESQDLRDEDSTCTDSADYNCLDHMQTRSQPETYELIAKWRSIVDSYSVVGPGRRILLTDGDVEVEKAMDFYGTYGRGGGANLPINYQLMKANNTCDSSCIGQLVYAWLDSMPTNTTADWFTGDQDRSRQMSQVDGQEMFGNIFNMLKMTLPGTAFIYYGEEIGMANGNNSGADPAGLLNPKFSRDGYRTPMQWTNETNAGFTNHSSTWIPVPTESNFDPWNVEAQKSLKGGVMDQLQILIKLRADQKSLQFGKLHKSSQDNVFSFVREHEGFDRILVVGCFGDDVATTVDLTQHSPSIGIPKWGDVVFVTNSTMKQKVGESADLKSVSLSPGQGFIAKWAYARP